MPGAAALLSRHRVLAVALAASAALHVALLVTAPSPPDPLEAVAQPFSAELLPPPPALAPAAPTPPAQKPAAPRHAPHVARRAHRTPAKAPPPAPKLLTAMTPSADLPVVAPPVAQAPAAPPLPEPVALAEPIIPWMPAMPPPAPQPAPFPMDALPERLSIDYRLSTGPLTAHAVYRWRRKGDTYHIIGEGEATGLFRVFMDGSILQESEGTITAAGLRPERFLEKRSGADDEGLDFDWLRHEVTLERGEKRKTVKLGDDTVDWLTMIFQLAHVPPRSNDQALDLHVFTQRKLYDFNLKVVGLEQIEIPLGNVRALHLRHVDPDDGDVMDVWLGVDEHYLPVKMRYPVGKVKLMIEQSASRISER